MEIVKTSNQQDIYSFNYKLGKLETSIPWLCPPPLSNVNEWLKDFRKLDFGGLKAYIGGKYMIAPNNTNDVDICLTGPILDWDILYKLMYDGMDLALNKHQIFVDIKHYDNIDFFDYPREDGFKRLHIMTQLSGIEEKEMNGVTTRITTHKTNISGLKYIPKNLAVNLTEFPLDKQIIDKRIYKPLLIN